MKPPHKKLNVFRRSLRGALDVRVVVQRFLSLVQKPVFWLLTFWGNVFVIGGAGLMFHLERAINPEIRDFLDCLIWAVGIVTTVGSSQIQAVTSTGKVLTILLMVGGAVFLWSYMALFIGALIDPELQVLEQEMLDIQSTQLQEKSHGEQKQL